MQIDLLSEVRLNRLLANARLTVAVFFVSAVLIDPDPRQPLALYALLTYLGVAAATLIYVALNADRLRSKFFLLMFCIDFVASVLITYTSAGSSSPFASMFILLILSASGRWGSRGAVFATAGALLVFAGTGVGDLGSLSHADVDWQRLIGRAGLILTVGGLIVAFARYEEGVRGEIQRLSSIGLGPPHVSDRPPVVRCIEHALMVLNVERAVLIWGDPEEPTLSVTRCYRAQIDEQPWSGAPDQPHPMLEELHQPFLADLTSGFSRMMDAAGRPTQVSGETLASPLLSVAGMDRVLVVPIQATGFMGWLMIETHDMRGEHLLIGATLAAQLSVMVEGWRSLTASRDAAAAEARIRIGRDLHDGILQFLAGTALQLEAIDRNNPLQEGVRERLGQIRRSLAQEQGELRGLITALEVGPARLSVDWIDFASETQRLVAMLRRHWSVKFEVSLDSAFYSLPSRLASELLQIVREASSNAVRHGGARKVELLGVEHDGGLALTISDNGHGMPEHGAFSLLDLVARDLGPRSVRARVQGLSGDLTMESSAAGVTLRLHIPMVRAIAA